MAESASENRARLKAGDLNGDSVRGRRGLIDGMSQAVAAGPENRVMVRANRGLLD
jgi:hypothetical protein